MTHKLWFIVPAHGRLQLARICLTQLKRTCDLLAEHGVEASAVIVADDENLDTARNLGFATVERGNTFVSAKYNDGIQFACDRRFNPRPVDYVVPCGSDDWVDPRLFLNLPARNEIVAFRQCAIVREDGRWLSTREVNYTGGVGIRIYPRSMMERLRYRPADEDRKRGCDTSILVNLTRTFKVPPTIRYCDLHPHQIVDWKTPDAQLNPYAAIVARFPQTARLADPFTALADTFPRDALREMRAHYTRTRTRELVAA